MNYKRYKQYCSYTIDMITRYLHGSSKTCLMIKRMKCETFGQKIRNIWNVSLIVEAPLYSITLPTHH